MKSTVSIDLLFFVLLLSGCSIWSPCRYGLAEAQRDARSRLLEVRRAELLDRAAKLQIEHSGTVPLLHAAQNYPGKVWNAADDPALKKLDAAIIYAKIAMAADPSAEAAHWAAKLVDFETAVLCCKWVCQSSGDVQTSLCFVTGWDQEKLRQFDRSTLKTPEFQLFPAHPESESRLQKEGVSAPFLLAAELYRAPSRGTIAAALQFRRTLLNSHLLLCGMNKESAEQRILELRLIKLREELLPL